MGHVFFDESGKFNDSDFVCIAGYISDDDGWNRFSEKWRGLLLRHDIPYVHMKEMIALKGAYRDKGWDATERDSVLADFLDVIREHVWVGFGVAVNAAHLRGMGADAKKKIGDPQLFCFQRIIGVVIRKLEEVGYEPTISAVFDDSEEYSVKCYRIWSRLRSVVPMLRTRVPSITFADDKHFYLLQAADVLAWETNKSMRQRAGNLPVRKQLSSLMKSIEPGYGLEHVGEVWNESALDGLYRDIQSGKVPSLPASVGY